MYLDGIAVPIIDGAAGSEVAALALQLNGVFCRTSGVCLAVGSGIDGGGVLVPLTNGAIGNGGGSVGGVRSLDGVACRIASACLAVGHRSVVVPMTRKKPGVANPVSGTGELSGLACNGPTFCLAVGSTTSNEGAMVRITSAKPAITKAVPGASELNGIACPSLDSCLAVGQDASSEGVIDMLPLRSTN